MSISEYKWHEEVKKRPQFIVAILDRTLGNVRIEILKSKPTFFFLAEQSNKLRRKLKDVWYCLQTEGYVVLLANS